MCRLNIKSVFHFCSILHRCRFVFLWLFDVSGRAIIGGDCGADPDSLALSIQSVFFGDRGEKKYTLLLLLIFTCGGKLPGSPLSAYQDAEELQSLEICYERSVAVVSALGS